MDYDIPLLLEISDIEKNMLKNMQNREFYKELENLVRDKMYEIIALTRSKLKIQEEYINNLSTRDRVIFSQGACSSRIDYVSIINNVSDSEQHAIYFEHILQHFKNVPPTEEDIYVYRGLTSPHLSIENNALFVSTSTNIFIAASYTNEHLPCCLYRLLIPKGSKILPLYMLENTRYQTYAEILLPVQTTYLNIEKLDFTIYIDRLPSSKKAHNFTDADVEKSLNIQNILTIPPRKLYPQIEKYLTVVRKIKNYFLSFKKRQVSSEIKYNSFYITLLIEPYELISRKIFDLTSWIEFYFRYFSDNYNVDYDDLLENGSIVVNSIRYFYSPANISIVKKRINYEAIDIINKSIYFAFSQNKNVKTGLNVPLIDMIIKTSKFEVFFDIPKLIEYIRELSKENNTEEIDIAYTLNLISTNNLFWKDLLPFKASNIENNNFDSFSSFYSLSEDSTE